jgi:ribosomal protein S18 acetylase RimI-like enzyme
MNSERRGEITLRPVDAADEPFLRSLFESTRKDLIALPLPHQQKAALIDMQYRAQRTQYDANYPDSRHDIILCEGVAVGAIRVERSPERLRLIDIAMLPEWQRKGIGTHLVRDLIGEGLPVVLHVAIDNPARALYERLGFEVKAAEGIYLRMDFQGENHQV